MVVEKVKSSAWEIGYNAMNDTFCDLLAAGESVARCSTRWHPVVQVYVRRHYEWPIYTAPMRS